MTISTFSLINLRKEPREEIKEYGGNKITGYFRVGRNLLIFWSKCFIPRMVIQGHDARNWKYNNTMTQV